MRLPAQESPIASLNDSGKSKQTYVNVCLSQIESAQRGTDGYNLAGLLTPAHRIRCAAPPGQYLTTDFSVLSAGPTPNIPLDQ